MKVVRILSILALALVLASSAPAAAQGSVTLSIDDVQHEQMPEMRLLVTVRDANGIPIVGLGPESFEIVEDGRNTFPPADVGTQINPDAATSIMQTIDISGSMEGEYIEEAQRASNALLDRMSPADRAALIAFADEVDLDSGNLAEGREIDFTTDRNAVRNVVNFLDTQLGWDTPLYDAIFKAVELTSREPVGKRAVVLITDGRDERDNKKGTPVADAGSLTAPDDPINEAARHGIPVFAIGLGGKIDSKYLSRLALRTGGEYRETPNPEELTMLLEGLIDNLKQQYVLTYESTLPEDTSPHSIMVRVNLPQGQAWDEKKVQFKEAPPPTKTSPPSTATTEAASTVGPTVPAATATPVPEPTDTTEGIMDTITDTIADQPELAIVIGAGLLLLLALIIALVVILLRGRKKGDEGYADAPYEEPYAPGPDYGVPTGPPAPMQGATMEEKTEAAAMGWGDPGQQATALDAQVPGAPVAGVPAADMPDFGPPPGFGEPDQGAQPPPSFPEAGGTKVMVRGPRYAARLVDRSQPSVQYEIAGTMNVGRSQSNDIVLDHPTVSRKHAWVKAEEGQFLVFDIGSANGTFVNDEQVRAPRELGDGDLVRFGNVEFKFSQES